MITTNNILKGAFIFTIGAAVGGLVVYNFMTKKDEYVEINEKTIVDNKPDTNTEAEDEIVNEDSIIDKISKTYATTNETVNYSDMYKKSEENDEKSDIYVIDPSEYGWNVDYTFSFTLFADNILSDEMGDKIMNSESRIGREILTEFIDSDSDEIYIRNEKTKSDYEIVKDERRYSDVYCS